MYLAIVIRVFDSFLNFFTVSGIEVLEVVLLSLSEIGNHFISV